MNRVESLLEKPFHALSHEEKVKVKQLGPFQPCDYSHSITDGKYKRHFKQEWFKQFRWLTVNTENNKLYCFNCLTFGEASMDPKWAKTGFSNLKNFIERATKHANSAAHLNSTARFGAFGTANIASQIDTAYRQAIERHNEAVTHNRHILSKIIDVIKFCGTHELALRGHDESESSSNKGVFKDLVSLLSTSDTELRTHLETATVNKFTSPTIQNELLDCIYDVYIENMTDSLSKARFVAVQADETTDVSCSSQFVIILRFVENCAPVERILKFVDVHDRTGPGLARVIVDVLGPYNLKDKLIAQAYDGAAVMGGQVRGVQTIVRETHPNAHYIHCYAHQTNLVLQKLSTNILAVNLFFASLSGLSNFFSASPKRMDVLKAVCNQRLPRTCETRWNFRSRILKTVSENKDEILEALKEIQCGRDWDHKSKQEALGLYRAMEDDKFQFFLVLFKDIFMHTDTLLNTFQHRQATGIALGNAIQAFSAAIGEIREKIPDLLPDETTHRPTPIKRQRTDSLRASAFEVCDILTTQLSERLEKSEFLHAFCVVDPNRFIEFRTKDTDAHISVISEHYSCINAKALKTELGVLYSNESFHSESTNSVLKLYKYLVDCDLIETFHEVTKLLEIVLTTPVHTAEPERAFSTLKRIKTFSRNTTSQSRLNALAVLSVHKDLIMNDNNFNHRVIEKFATHRDRRTNLIYKTL